MQGHQFIKNRAERINIAACIDRVDLTACLFGRHVCWSSSNHAFNRALRFGIITKARNGVFDVLIRNFYRFDLNRAVTKFSSPDKPDFSQAPIHQHDFAKVTNHNVRWFQIAMDHAFAVRECHGVAHRDER